MHLPVATSCPRRNKAAQRRQPKQLAHAINLIWSMDFMADALFDGRKLRMLTVVDLFSRECLAIDVGQSLKGEDVARVLTAITEVRGLPCTIKSDNGGEFISKVMDKWAYERGVGMATDVAPEVPTGARNMTSRSVSQVLAGQWRQLIWTPFLAVVVGSFLGGLGTLLETPRDQVHGRQTAMSSTTTGDAERFADIQRFWRASSGLQLIVSAYLSVDTLLFIPVYAMTVSGL
jgi:hypothetical protein